MKRQPDTETIAEFRAGSREAYGAVYTYYYKYVFVIAFAFLADGDVARDIASETFLKLWKYRRKFKTPGEVKAWLIVACRHASLNEQRSRQRRQLAEKELLFLSPKKQFPHEHQLIREEVLYDLLLQVDSLSPRCGEVLELIFFQGKKTIEVAGQLGISPITVQTHKMNALKKLRAFRQRFIISTVEKL